MKNIIVLITSLFLFMGIKANAQVKPSQAQYLQEKGVFLNPGFESGYKGWTITGCSKDRVTEIPYMGKSLKLTCSGESFSIKQETTELAGSNLESFAGCRVKASASGVAYRTLEDGAQLNASAVAAGDFKRFEESFTAGATSNGVEIYSVASYTGTVIVEDCFIGTTPDGYLADPFPDQSGNSLKVLSTNGSTPLWRIAERLNAKTKDNLLSNPSFENGAPDGTITLGSGIDLSGSTTRTSQESPHNASRFSLLGSAADTIEYKVASTEDFTGSQMIAFCEYRTTRASTYFRVYSGGVLQGEKLLETDNVWRYVSIPFKGGTNPEFTISGDTATAEEISIDNCFLGKQNPNAVQSISDAHFVGRLQWKSANCTWSGGSTSFSDFAADSDCAISEKVGAVDEPDTKIPAVKLLNVKTNGYYKITATNAGYTGTNDGCYFTLQDGGGEISADSASVFRAAPENNISTLSVNAKFNTGGDKEIRIKYALVAGTACYVLADSGYGTRSLKFNVHFYPDEPVSSISADSLSPDKAGFLIWSAFDGNVEGHKKADGSCVKAVDYPDYARNVGSTYGTCTVDTTNDGFNLPDLISNNRFLRAAGGSLAVGTLQDDLFESHNHTQGAAVYTNISLAYGFTSVSNRAGSASTSSIASRLPRTSSTGGSETRPVNMAMVPFIKMHDRNKIIGTFEQIEEITADLAISEVNEYTATIDAASCSVDAENYAGWITSSTDIGSHGCTINYSGLGLTVGPKVNTSASYISSGAFGSTLTSPSTSGFNIYCVNRGSGAISTGCGKFYIHVSRQGADYNKSFKGAVINASKYKELCQKKWLTSNTGGATGNIADMTFNNLEIGKKYRISAQIVAYETTTSSNIKESGFQFIHNGTGIARSYFISGANTYWRVTGHPYETFTATDTTLIGNVYISNFSQLISGEHVTNATLCEIREDVIDTTKFQ